MEITNLELSALKKFQKDLGKYHDTAMKVYRVVNGRDYVSDEERTKRVKQEKKERASINAQFGNLEPLIYNLMGGKPFMVSPLFQNLQLDVFAEAFSSDFNRSVKGECLERSVDYIDKAVGRASGATILSTRNKVPKSSSTLFFDEHLLKKISQQKIKKLCIEFNNIHETSPNAGALLFRTIILVTLQYKLGKSAKDDLKDVINQALGSDAYGDKQITRILKSLQGIPKTLLDATHHSQWILISADDLKHWAQGLRQILVATFK